MLILRTPPSARATACSGGHCDAARPDKRGARWLEHPSTRKPNIVIILADDVGIGDITAYDSTAPEPTPNIDALAAAGTLLHDAHAQVVCAPSRVSLLAGRHPYDVEWNYGSGSSIKASIQSNAHHFLSAPAVK